jgi:hypothetical protein
VCLNDEGKFAEAVDVLREAISIKRSVKASPESRETCESQFNSDYYCPNALCFKFMSMSVKVMC